ncbi:MAG: hypothetical protein J1E63_06415 [Muribaculaceae bacterium]|nr:hypothetical protein [Muribaculaceae bacterium]
MTNFDRWNDEFRLQNMFVFNNNANGLLWLKVRAICRAKQLERFLEENDIVLKGRLLKDRNRELFELLEQRPDAMQMLDKFLKCIDNEWYRLLNVDAEKLHNDLYEVHNYEWGGDHNNSLDKYLISRYVKNISNYSDLLKSKGEIAVNAWNYVQNSWYNNWTSFLIESMFKKHPNVISAVGEIKSVDIFIGDYPIDIKVTFFPKEFLDLKVKQILGKNILSWLKWRAKEYGIKVDRNSSNFQQIYTLTEKLKEQNLYSIINELEQVKKIIIQDSIDDPLELLTWLYTNQGEMRFGSENRLFVVLADTDNLDESWKMKRNISLIGQKVKNYLNSFSPLCLKEINFSYNGGVYKSLSDILFIVK